MLGSILSSLDGTTIGLLVVSCLVFAWYRSVRRPSGFPPGPSVLPIVGNYFALDGHFHNIFNNWSKIYGDVFSFKFGGDWCVVLNSLEAAKEAFLKNQVEFAGRPRAYSIELLTAGYKDIALSPYSETWKIHRKIGHEAIRHFASGKNLEKLVYNVLPKIAKVIDAMEGKSFAPKDTLSAAVYNIIAYMCFGHQYSFDDPKLKIWIDFNKDLQEFDDGLPADYLSILQYIPTGKQQRFVKILQTFDDEMKAEFKAHRETYDPENIRDLIDILLQKQKEAIADGSAKADSLTQTHLRQTVGDILSAGTDTSTATLHWGIALMAKNPDVQEKVAQEMDNVVGRDRLPELSDRAKLPYTVASMNELLRYSSVAPVGLIHAAMVDAKLGNYLIPKGTWLMFNQWAVHFSEKHWDEPFKFKPEHFLDESGEVRPHPDGFVPFTFGRRVCLGESLANGEIFLLFSWLFQHYTFSIPSDQKEKFELKLDQSSPIRHQLDDYFVVAKKRF